MCQIAFQKYTETIGCSNTRAAYSRDLAQFAEWLEGEGLTVSGLRPKHLTAYRSYLEARISRSSVNRNLSAVRGFIRFLVEQEEIEPSVFYAAQSVRGVRPEQRLPRPLSDKEVEDLLCQPNPGTLYGARDLVFILLLVRSGLRVSEAVGLDLRDVLLDRQKVYVFGKGAKERVAFINDETVAAIQHYLALRGNPSEGPLFVNKNGQRVSVRWMEQQVAEYGKRIGRDDLHPHLLRHTFATAYLNRTGNLDAVQRQLGHSRADTTRIYTQLATDHLEPAYRRAFSSVDSRAPYSAVTVGTPTAERSD